MKIIDNTTCFLGDDLKASVGRGTRLRIAASCFSIYAFEALKSEFSEVDNLQFIFTASMMDVYYGPDELKQSNLLVFRDNGFVSDAVKINVIQIFRQLSPTTEVKSI